MSKESLIILSNVLFHAFTKLKQYEQLPENYNSSFKMYCGFSVYVDMIFPDGNKVILANRGHKQILLWALPDLTVSFTSYYYNLYLSQILNGSQKEEGMMELVNIDALLFNWRLLPRG